VCGRALTDESLSPAHHRASARQQPLKPLEPEQLFVWLPDEPIV
jgi:hypothetical protein